MSPTRHKPKARVQSGTLIPIDIPGVTAKFEDGSGRLVRIKLDEGGMLSGDPHDLNTYYPDKVQLHRTNRYPQRGTDTSRRLGQQLVVMADVESLQFIGQRTIIIYLERAANIVDTCELYAMIMLGLADNPLNP